MYGPGDVRFFDRLARLYDLAMPPVRADELASGLACAERPLERVVDLGGGTGRAAAALSTVPERIVADVSAEMLRRARERRVEGEPLQSVWCDGRRLPLRDGSVDAVLLVDALHHLPQQTTALAETARVLAPGGVLVIREFDPETLRGKLVVRGERLLGMRSMFTPPDDVARAVERTGLDATVVDRGFGYTVVGVKQRE